MALQVLHHALHGARDGEGAATGERVAGVGGKVAHFAGGHMQAGRARLQRAQHDAVPRQDDAAQEASLGVDGLDRDRRAHHHHHTGTRRPPGQQPLARTDHGDPAVRPQARRVVISVGHARFAEAGDHPLRRHVPQFQLLLHPTLDRIPRHNAAHHPLRCGQRVPVAFGQLFDVLQELRSMGQQPRAHTGCVVECPFQAGVPNVQGQKSHGRIIPRRLP